jgi:Lrp/AsnC family transcriptional regulator, leucine-responsive regulatory protein
MRLSEDSALELDDIDLRILGILQDDCRASLSRIGEAVSLSAPAVLERIKKLEAARVIRGYHATLDARLLGLDVTAFIGVTTSRPELIERIEQQIGELDEVLECHHVTGEHTLLLKVKTANTSTLERLISRIRSFEGVARTETVVVLSTHTERSQVELYPTVPPAGGKRVRRGAERNGGNGRRG